MTRFQMILKAMSRVQQSAAKKGYDAFCERGYQAENPFHKQAEATKWSAWQTGFECACGSDVR